MGEISVVVHAVDTGDGKVAHGATPPERFRDRVGDITDAIEMVVKELQPRLQSAEAATSGGWRASEVTLAFSLDLEVEAGVIIAKSKATAGFSVEVKWARDGRSG
jgi:Trypsin-co-occurring domain 1